MDLLAGYESSDKDDDKASLNEEESNSSATEGKEDRVKGEDDQDSNQESSEDSDDESEEDDNVSEEKNVEDEVSDSESQEKPVTALPSAADLFSSTGGPDFLDTSVTREFIAPSLKRKSLARDPEQVARQKMEKKKKVISASAAAGVVTSEKEAIKFQGKAQKAKKESVGPFMPKAEKEQKKANLKERVKAQRLKGQAGIGSDFRTWRSEEEMKMRQGFD